MANGLQNALMGQNTFSYLDDQDKYLMGMGPRTASLGESIETIQPMVSSSISQQSGVPQAPSSGGAASGLGAASELAGGSGSPLGQALGGAASGAALGSMVAPGVGTAVGAGLGSTAMLLGGLFGAQADAEERKRQAKLDAAKTEFSGLQDALRTGAQQQGQAISNLDIGLQRALLGGR